MLEVEEVHCTCKGDCNLQKVHDKIFAHGQTNTTIIYTENTKRLQKQIITTVTMYTIKASFMETVKRISPRQSHI